MMMIAAERLNFGSDFSAFSGGSGISAAQTAVTVTDAGLYYVNIYVVV